MYLGLATAMVKSCVGVLWFGLLGSECVVVVVVVVVVAVLRFSHASTDQPADRLACQPNKNSNNINSKNCSKSSQQQE